MKISTNEMWQSAKVLALALILSAGVSTAFAWTGPTATAPAGNTAAPVNVSATSQVKSGGLGVTNLVADQLCLGTSCITAWPTGGATKIIAGSGISVSPSSGTGDVTVSNTGGWGNIGYITNGGSGCMVPNQQTKLCTCPTSKVAYFVKATAIGTYDPSTAPSSMEVTVGSATSHNMAVCI